MRPWSVSTSAAVRVIGVSWRSAAHSSRRNTFDFGPDAAAVLGLDPEVMRSEGTGHLAPVLETLSGGTEQDAVAALDLLRTTLVGLGSKSIPTLQAANQAVRVDRLRSLARRIVAARVVPGLTVHQAKGREWSDVGVVLADGELTRLGNGLSQGSEADRRLYVALTRARLSSVRI